MMANKFSMGSNSSSA